MDAKILFVSLRTEDAEFCRAIAKKLGIECVQISHPDVLSEEISKNHQCLVFLDVDHENAMDLHAENSIHQLLDRLSKTVPASRIFALADKSLFELPKLSRMASIGNYCLRRYDPFCMDWVPKLALQKFKDPGAKEVTLKLTHSKDKEKALQGIEKLLTAKGLNERCVQMILQAADELIMNAIFDAPLDDKGRPYRKSVPRDSALHLFDREEIEISIVLNEKTILIQIQDQFGSFSSEKAFAVIQKDYGVAGYKTDAFTQSAGLGLHGVVASGLGLMINVTPNISTQAVIAFPLFENFKSMRKSFHSFSLNIKA